MTEIYNACSFGPACMSASILKRNNIKKCSYPFDWIFSDHYIVKHCIEDNFITFLDKSYYVDIKDKWHDNQCGHERYHPNMFNHRDIRNKENYEYFKRCVNRFLSLMRDPKKKLFVITNINLTSVDPYYIIDIVNFNESISHRIQDYTLLVIFHLPNKEVRSHVFRSHKNIQFLELHTLSSSNGNKFIDEEDNNYLDSILKNAYIFR